jgi:hypothetical protein
VHCVSYYIDIGSFNVWSIKSVVLITLRMCQLEMKLMLKSLSQVTWLGGLMSWFYQLVMYGSDLSTAMCDMEKKPASTGEVRKPTKKRSVKPTKSDNGSTPATGASSQASSSAGSSLTNSRVSTPSIAPSNAASSGSTSAAASCSNSAAALASAELSKPRYQYSRVSHFYFAVLISV